jgi:hypothetical protein
MENVSILSYDDKDLNISNNVTLSMPSSVQGGSYFTKIHYAKRPLYMQTPKCVSKQGIITIGKKMYIELVVSNEKDGEFISFLENLEKTCIDIIFEKRHIWFTDELEKTDIETAFASIIKSYKNGTSHLLKLNINNTSNHAKHGIGIGGLQTCFVFDENNNSLKFDDVRPETPLITIMEFEGIKFTSKSFLFEMNARQILIIDEKPIFNSCLIKPKKKDEQNEFDERLNDKNCGDELKKTEESVLLSSTNTTTSVASHDNDAVNAVNIADDNNDDAVNIAAVNIAAVNIAAVNASEAASAMQNELKEQEPEQEQEPEFSENKKNEECLGELVKAAKGLEIKTSQPENKKVNKENVEEHDDELVEVNLELPQELDSGFEKIKLQNANEVYYKMYKEAKEKAKSAKKIAVEAYLAAEEIKFTYNLVDNESDSDNSSSEGESESESENEYDNHNHNRTIEIN